MLQGNADTISKRHRSVRETTARLVGGLDEVLSIEEERRGSSCRLKLVVTECASGREDLMVYLRIVNQKVSWYFEINRTTRDAKRETKTSARPGSSDRSAEVRGLRGERRDS